MADQETEDLRRTIRDLTEAMADYQRSGALSDRSLQNLRRAQDRLADVTDDQTTATEKAEQALKDFYRGTKQALQGFGDTAQQLRDNREQFTSLNPAIRATSGVFQSAARGIGNMGDAVGAVVGGLTALVPGVGMFASVLTGLGAKKLTEALGGISEEAVKAGEAFFTFSTAELDRVTGAFRQLGSVGAVSAEGMDALYNASIQAGLSVNQFAQLVSQNSMGLSFATGSATESARAIAEITQAAKPFQNQLLALGFGLEQQSEVFADYIVMSRRLGRQQTRDYATLAQGASEYAFELDELARLTGMSRQEAQKALEAQMSNTRFRATLAKAEMTGGDTLVKAIRGTAAGVEAFGGRRLAEGFQDAFGGLGTEAARQFEFATGGLGRQIAEQLRSGAITQDQALEQIQQSIQGKLQGMGGLDFIERVGKMGTFIDPMMLEMIEFSQRAGVTAEDMARLRDEQQKARASQSKNTQNVIQAQQSMQALAVQVDTIVKDQIFPNASAAVSSFTNALNAGLKMLIKLAPGIEYQERAKGGPVDAGKPYLVGEQGPEMIVPQVAGSVFTNENTQQVLQHVADNAKIVQDSIGSLKIAESMGQYIESLEMKTGATLGRSGNGNFALSDAFGKTTFNSQGEWMKHQFATMVEGLTTTLFANGNRSIMYNAGGANVKYLLDEQNKLLKENKSYAIAGEIFSQERSFAGGGIASGPKSGYTAMLHGTEAVVPLPDGKSIPVDASQSESNNKLLQAMESLNVTLQQVATNTRQGADTNKQLLRATTS